MSRNADVVARYAGDEFVLILPETTKESAELLMKRICANLSEHPLIVEDITIPVSISFGIASTRDKGMDSPQSILRKADKMLYAVKNGRKEIGTFFFANRMILEGIC